MKRKVVKHGPSTLTISLPSKWCKENKIEEGNELEIKELESNLIIKSRESNDNKTIKLDLSGFGQMTSRILTAFYREGYDGFELKYSTSEELDMISHALQRVFIGFEIIEHKDNSLLIKKLASLEYQEFENIYRKLFLIVNDIAEESFIAIKKNDKNKLKSLLIIDKNVNRFSDFCIRIICQQKIPLKNSGTFHHLLADQIENIGDEYTKINSIFIENEIKMSKNIESIFNKVNLFFHFFYQLFYNFQLKKMTEFWKVHNGIQNDIKKLKNNSDNQENSVIMHLENINNMIFEMYDSLIIINN